MFHTDTIVKRWSDRNPYETYFLRENPFPIVPIPEEKPRIFSIHEEVYRKILWQLYKVARTGRPIHVVVVGPYGSGKTHLLRYLTSYINSHVREGFAAYVPHPGPDFISIYRHFVGSLGYERLKALSYSLEKDELRKAIVYQDFVTALVKLNDPHRTLEAWRWLTANRLTLEERKMLRVATSIERSEDALNAFSALLKFLRKVGFKLICLLIDEFEEISSLVQLQKKKLFNDLRHLIDLNVANFSLIVACSPQGWNTIYEENAALVRRFSSNLVFLRPLNEQECVKLISSYLDSYRIHRKAFQSFLSENGYEGISRTYPFTIDAISEIYALSKGNVGEVLKYSGIAIEMGAMEGCTLIDAKILRSLVARYYGTTMHLWGSNDEVLP